MKLAIFILLVAICYGSILQPVISGSRNIASVAAPMPEGALRKLENLPNMARGAMRNA